MIRRALQAALLLAGTLARAQTPHVTVRDAGPGPVGRLLEATLRRPDTRIVVADTFTLARDSTSAGSLVVIGRQASVKGGVGGDVIVVGGDLFLKPGARIDGGAIAIGGGAHGTALGWARRGLTSYRDFTFDAVRTDQGIELRYREQYVGARRGLFELPAFYGLRIPMYDRSNGLSLPIGPTVNAGAGTIDLIATYRSQTGQVDPSVSLALPLLRRTRLDAFAGRETRSHDKWINGELSNSLNSFLTGRDERNWYRATGAWATLSRVVETSTMTATYSLGGSFERATAARPAPFPTSGPWSILERRDVDDGMFRPNPQIAGGDITSVIGGAGYRWSAGVIEARLDVDVEVPLSVSRGDRFVQSTVDGRIDFPTFGLQRYRFELHAIATVDSAPGQRVAYLGGSGTLPTDEVLLARGGDELIFMESRYEIPVPRLQLPFVGPPRITFRHILGAVGVQRLPDLTQIVGVRASIASARVQWLIDTGTRRTRFSAGLSLSR